MKGLDCNKVKIFINLEIIGEKDKYKKLYLFFKNSKKKFCNLVQPRLLCQTFIIQYMISTQQKKI